MKFPMANISVRDWDPEEDYLIYILEDQFIYNNSSKVYRDYFLHHRFVDSEGNVYKITGKKQPDTWRQLLSFLPGIYKGELVFSKEGERVGLEQVRQHILVQLFKLDDDENKQEWIKKVKEAHTYEEIIFS